MGLIILEVIIIGAYLISFIYAFYLMYKGEFKNGLEFFILSIMIGFILGVIISTELLTTKNYYG
jgi:hypothetical protein